MEPRAVHLEFLISALQKHVLDIFKFAGEGLGRLAVVHDCGYTADWLVICSHLKPVIDVVLSPGPSPVS